MSFPHWNSYVVFFCVLVRLLGSGLFILANNLCFMTVVLYVDQLGNGHMVRSFIWFSDTLCNLRCSQEMQDALQMAMTGHARLLDQYAELQEKHIVLLAKMREIGEGVNDIKKVAKKSGVSSVDDRWFEVQATQIVFMKVEQDQYKAEIKGLQAQLRDTSEAVQAAGELLVRMKEAEQSAATAKVISPPPIIAVHILAFGHPYFTDAATMDRILLGQKILEHQVNNMIVSHKSIKEGYNFV